MWFITMIPTRTWEVEAEEQEFKAILNDAELEVNLDDRKP